MRWLWSDRTACHSRSDETSELNVRTFGNSAVVTGRLLRERSTNGKTITDNWRFTKTYVMVEGRWRVVAWHASPAA